MGLSYPRPNSIDIIALGKLKYWIGIKPMSLTAPWADSLEIISLIQLKKLGINPVGLSSPWANSFYIIALQTERKKGCLLTQWDLVSLGPTILILFHSIHLK